MRWWRRTPRTTGPVAHLEPSRLQKWWWGRHDRDHVFDMFKLMVLGFLFSFAIGIAYTPARWSTALFTTLVALASAAVGGFIGLLFGIPRSSNALNPPAGGTGSTSPRIPTGRPSPTTPDAGSVQTAAAGASAGATTTSNNGYGPNTNLEEVSDWLTKLLLGAGLTQIARLPGALGNLGDYLAKVVVATGWGSIFATIVVLNVLTGFFYAFLGARIRLGRVFNQADQRSREVLQTSNNIYQVTERTEPLEPGTLSEKTEATLAEKSTLTSLARQVVRQEYTTPGTAFDLEAYERLVRSLVAIGRPDPALSLLDVAMAQFPNEPSLPVTAGAIMAMNGGDLDHARQYYYSALRIDPNYAMAHYNLGCAAARAGILDEIDQRDPERVAAAVGQQDQAVDFIKQAVRLSPELADQVPKDPLWEAYPYLPGSGLEAYIGGLRQIDAPTGGGTPQAQHGQAPESAPAPMPKPDLNQGEAEGQGGGDGSDEGNTQGPTNGDRGTS